VYYKCGGISYEQIPFSLFSTAVFYERMGNFRQLLTDQQNLLALLIFCAGTNSGLLPVFISFLPCNYGEEGIANDRMSY
jgi:hypothetical protein